MINRDNYYLVQEYLEYRSRIKPKSIKLYRTNLTGLLEFAEETPFRELPEKTNAQEFIQHIDNNRRDGKEKPLKYEYKRKFLGNVRRFLIWLMETKEMTTINKRWIYDFRPDKSNKYTNNKKPRYSEEEIEKIAATPVSTTNEERTRAAFLFLYLSGMRIGAFVTLPIEAVNLEKRQIHQFPSLGVKTKLNKSKTTFLINKPEFLSIVKKWDRKVKQVLTPNDPWFAPLSVVDHEIDPNATIGNSRTSGLRKDIKAFTEKANVEYKRPHAIRHSHIRFLRDQATNTRELEAIAANAMQEVPTMLKYGELDNAEVKQEITKLCRKNSQGNKEDVNLDRTIEKLKVILDALLQKKYDQIPI